MVAVLAAVFRLPAEATPRSGTLASPTTPLGLEYFAGRMPLLH